MNAYVLIVLSAVVCVSTTAAAEAYSTRFEGEENPLSDGGKWQNSGLDWTSVRASHGIAFGTQAGTNTGARQYDDSYAHLSGFPPDQEAWGQAYIATPDPSCHQELEILLRWASSPHRTTGYECFARCVNDGASYVQIVRWEGPLGKFTYLADLRGTNYGLKHGDILKASAVGNVITVYINGVEKARVTDDTYKTGNPGIGFFLHAKGSRGIGSNTNFGFTSFAARGLGETNRQSAPSSSASPIGSGNTRWMSQGKFGIFMHYQYRILLGYSVRTKPQFPNPSQMTAEGWNRFVDGFDVNGFAQQMGEAKVGWVIFCLDDHYFAWPCAPNKAFSEFSGYAPGEKCSRRDLIMDLADALNPMGVKLICYFAGLNGYMNEPKVSAGLMDGAAGRGGLNENSPPLAEGRQRRLAVLKEYADRYKDKIAGWWFDGMELNTYQAQPHDWWEIHSIVHSANPQAVIAFSCGRNEQACIRKGIDDYTGGDTWSKQDLQRLTPAQLPSQEGLLWHGKIYCGNVYHGQGDDNQFRDQELIDWINTCNSQGGVCTLDWPFDPRTGRLKEFGIAQLKRVRQVVNKD